MAYTTATFNIVVPGIGASPTIWTYTNAADAIGTVVADGYFSDGADKGLKAGDWVLVKSTSGGTPCIATSAVDVNVAVFS